MPDSILFEGNEVVGDGSLEAGGREDRLAPGLAEGEAGLRGRKVAEGPDAPGLVQDPAVGIVVPSRRQISPGEAAEFPESEAPDGFLLNILEVEGD